MAGGFVEKDAAGDGGVEGFDRAGHGDGDAGGGAAEDFGWDAGAFVAEDQGGGTGEVVLSELVAFSGDGGESGDAAGFERGEDFVFAGRDETGRRKTDPAEARRAFWFHGLTVPGRVMNPVAPKASAERMRVPRLPGSCRPAAMRMSGAAGRGEDLVEREVGRLDQGGDALGGFGADGAREDVGRQGEDFGGFGEAEMVEQMLASGADEDGGDGQAGGDGFQQKVFAFDGDVAVFRSGSAARIRHVIP